MDITQTVNLATTPRGTLTPVEPLTSADLMRELKKEMLDVYGTRARFAETLEVSDNTMGRYLRGEREMPADVLLRAIQGLGIDYETFFRNARDTRAVEPIGG